MATRTCAWICALSQKSCCFGAVFADYEREMIRERVLSGLERTKAKGTRLSRPPMDAGQVEAIRVLLVAGTGFRKTARRTGVGPSTVQRMHAAMLNGPRARSIVALCG